MRNLEEYVSLIVDATINAGISRQVEAFKSGFNQVCTITQSVDVVGRTVYLIL
jgi:E3 ubiquitin-protein ligase TRIP12